MQARILLRPIINGLTDTGKTGTQLLAGLIQGYLPWRLFISWQLPHSIYSRRIMDAISQEDAIKRLRNELFEKAAEASGALL